MNRVVGKGEIECHTMNLIFQELLSGVEVKLSTYNKEIFQKNFKHFLKNVGNLYEGNYNAIKRNESQI